MSKNLLKIFSNPFWLVTLAVVIKIPIFFTKHIQEDSFITWRVARNFLNYGVIGFNGEARISASTTHLYVFVSALFQLIFGGKFIYPLLIFSCVLFAIGTYWMGKILFPKDGIKAGVFVVLLNIVPPALASSCLGMEYGILFFLYSALLYFGVFRRHKWAFVLLPVLLLWTRIDTAVFLTVVFIADLILRTKINFLFVLGGLLGIGSVILFNYVYFGEWVNHTITAKKIAYKNLSQNNSWKFLLYQWAYYGGLIKKYSLVTFAVFVGFIAFVGFCINKIIKDKAHTSFEAKVVIIAVTVFALLKITLFAFLQAYFDWYYWLPRVFLFVVVLYYFLEYAPVGRKIVISGLTAVFLGLYIFQFLQSYAIGYMEHSSRMQIAKDIGKNNFRESIFLEPAGQIPFYTNLYTYDEVGLVNKKITDEMLKDENFWWINSVRKFHPDYILTVAHQPGDENSYYKMDVQDKQYFAQNYTLIKAYPISKVHENAPKILQQIYLVRPIGQNYFLYKRINTLINE